MAFKMKGFEPHNMYKTKKANTHKDHLALEKKGYDHNPYKKVSSFTKNGDFKKTKKKILSSTDIPTKEEPEGIPTEYTGSDDDYVTNVYKKPGLFGLGKKYVEEVDLEFNPTGNFQQITRKGIKDLKKEGSYVSGNKYDKIKDDYLSGEYQKQQIEKSNKKGKGDLFNQ